MSRNYVLAAVVLPLLVLVAGIVRSESKLAQGRAWVFDVTGYDPRDVLRGHYIQFQLDLHEPQPVEACDEAAGQTCCYCLAETQDGQPPRVETMTCATAQHECRGWVHLEALRGLRRYYVPEARATELEQTLRDAAARNAAQLKVRIDPQGGAQIEALLVDGELITSSDE